MKHSLPVLSASKIGLAVSCGYPFAPDREWHEEPDASAATFGRVVHAGAEAYARGAPFGPERFADLTPSARDDARRRIGRIAAWIDDTCPLRSHRVEEGLRYDVSNGEAWFAPGRGADGYEDAGFAVIPMTADLWWSAPGTRPVIVDYKTGRPKLADKYQIDTLGLALARALGVHAVDTVLLYVDEHGIRERRSTLDDTALDFHDHAQFLKRLVRDLPARGAPTPGEHCKLNHCPLLASCPESIARLASVAPTLPLGDVTTKDEAMALFVGLPLAEAALEGRRRALQAYCTQTPLVLDDGKTYGLHPQRERVIAEVTPEFERIIADTLGPVGGGIIKTERSASIGRLESAVELAARARKAAGQAKSIREGAEALMEELRKAGAFQIKEHLRCGVRRQKGS